MRFHPPEADDLAHRLGVIAVGLGFGVDVLDVVGDALLLFLKPLDTLDKQPQLIGRDIAFAHWSLPFSNLMKLQREAAH